MWEPLIDLDDSILSARLEVPGGWIVRTAVYMDNSAGGSCTVEQTFVSDPTHEWKLKEV